MSTVGERYDTKSNVNSDRFLSELEASCVSSHTYQLWFNETLCLWMTIYLSLFLLALIPIYRNDSEFNILSISWANICICFTWQILTAYQHV